MFSPFSAFTGFAGGIPEGYDAAQNTRLKKMARQQGETDLEIQKAFGRALSIPGATPLPPGVTVPGAAPQAPMPGAPSQPMQRPGAPTGVVSPNDPSQSTVWGDLPGREQPGPPSVRTAAYGGAPSWAPGEPPVPPSGAPVRQDSMGLPGQPPGTPPTMGSPMRPGGGMPSPQLGGMQLTWQSIADRVRQANPDAKPEVIAGAVTKFLPLMTAQSQSEWKSIQQMLQAERLDLSRERLDRDRERLDRRADAGGVTTASTGQPASGLLEKDAIEAAAQRYLKTGQLPPNLGRGVQGRTDMAMIQNRAAALAKEQGIDTADLPKRWQQFKASQIAIQRFESGKQGDTARSLNVAIDHLSTIDQLAAALKNGDVRLFNEIAQTIAQQTGNPAPTSLEVAKNIVAPEVIKAIGVAGAGTGHERAKAAQDAWNRAASPQQLAQAVVVIKKLLAGQLRGLRQQYIKSTGLPAKDFDEMMLPETLRQLEGLDHSAPSAKPGTAGGGLPEGWSVKVK